MHGLSSRSGNSLKVYDERQIVQKAGAHAEKCAA
jgi:hypothetical protein